MFRIPSLLHSVLVLLVLTATAFLVNAAHAETVVYTNKTEWQNAVGGQFLTEDFADSVLNPEVTLANSESGHINPAQECYQDVLASESNNEPMTVWSFTPQITAYGGSWTLGGPGGSGNNLSVSIGESAVYVGSISNSYDGGFWGFTSDTPFNAVRLVGGSGIHQQNYSLDDMVYSPVPEPATLWLLGGGLMAILVWRRRVPR